MTLREIAPNWLSMLIEPVLAKHMILNFRRVHQIAEAIEKSPQGNGLKDGPGLRDSIREGLDAADERQHEIEHDPSKMTGSPAVVASLVIAKRLGIILP